MTPVGKSAVKTAAEEALASGGITRTPSCVDSPTHSTGAGLHAEARAVYERAARLAPNRGAILAGLASATFEAGRVEDGNLRAHARPGDSNLPR